MVFDYRARYNERFSENTEVSPGTIYLYFKNKDELFVSLSLRILQFLCIRVGHVQKEERSSAGIKPEV